MHQGRQRVRRGCVVGILLTLWSGGVASAGTVEGWGRDDYGQAASQWNPADVVAVSGGLSHSVGLVSDGTVFGWGRNQYGQTAIPANLDGVLAIASGDYHNLALRTNGTVMAWGRNQYGQTSVPAGLSNVVAISAGGSHCLVLLRDGTGVGWGLNTSGQTRIPVGLKGLVAMSAGGSHSLALSVNGTVVGWGNNANGQTNVPANLQGVIAVAAGDSHSLALQQDGTVVAWGNNGAGQTNVPPEAQGAVAIAAGGTHSMALLADGMVVAWGGNGSGQTNVPWWVSGVVAIAGGRNHSLAAVGSGLPHFGPVAPNRQVLAGSTVSFRVPVSGELPFTLRWQFNAVDLPGASGHTLTLTNVPMTLAGRYRLRASNTWGAAVSSDVQLDVVPFRILTQPQPSAALLRGVGTFGVTLEGEGPFSYQWLRNGSVLPQATQATLNLTDVQWDQAGRYAVRVTNRHGTITSDEAPLTVNQVASWGGYSSYGSTNPPAGLRDVVGLASGYTHSLALKRDGTVAGWGVLEYRQQPAPVPAEAMNAVGVAAGRTFSAVQRSDGTVFLWSDYPLPSTNLWNGLRDVVSIVAGDDQCLTLHADGSVTGWGVWQTNRMAIPEELGPAIQVAGGGSHVLALRPEGTVVAWGNNGYGQTDVPPGLSNVIAVAAGATHSLALRSDGTCVAWGGNASGQTNVPVGLDHVVGIAAGGVTSLARRADGTVVSWGETGYGLANPPVGLNGVAAIAEGNFFHTALVGDGAPWFGPSAVRYTAVAGLPVHLIAPVSGAWPMAYQWSWNGADVPEATNAVLTIPSLRMDQGGIYRLAAGNSEGNALSPEIAVTVVPSRIRRQPRPIVVPTGQLARFTVEVDGKGPFTYRWLHDGATILGATNASYEIATTIWSDGGQYAVVVSNDFGVLTSASAELRVIPIMAWGMGEVARNAPADLTRVTALSAGGVGGMAARSDGGVAVWDSQGSYGWMTNYPMGRHAVGVAAGSYHCLALLTNGTVVGWAHPFYGSLYAQAAPPVDLVDAVSIAAGGDHSMALRADGSVVGWGNGYYGQQRFPSGLDRVVAIADGPYHSLALKGDGRVVAWGNNDVGQANVPPGLEDAIAIGIGSNHSLAVRANGTVVGWGLNAHGQAVPPVGLSDVVAVAAGDYHSMALRADGSVVVWGIVGDWPTNVPAWRGSGMAAIAGYGGYGLAMEGAGPPTFQPLVSKRYGFLGQNVRFHVPAVGGRPITYQWQFKGQDMAGATQSLLTLTNLAAAHAGLYRVLARNPWGTAQSAEFELELEALRVAQPPVSQKVHLGGSATFTAVLEGQGPFVCQWLFNGQPMPGRTNLTLALAGLDWADEGSYALRVSNAFGTTTSAAAMLELSPLVALVNPWDVAPTFPAGLRGLVGVSYSGYLGAALGLKADRTVVAWGDNTYGLTNLPPGLNDVVAVDANYSHCLALRANGTVVAWGNPEGGKTDVPVGLNQVVAIAAGTYHSLALKADGTVVAWGGGGGSQAIVPAGLRNVVAIAAGSFSLALRADGTMVGWGTYWSGFGNPTMEIPPEVRDIVAIGAGSGTALAVRSDGRVEAWGAAWYNQTLVPDALNDAVAVVGNYTSSMALRRDGTLMGWGNYLYTPILAPGVSNVVAMAGGTLAGVIGDGPPRLPPVVTQRSGVAGSTVHLNLPATGRPPLRYEWFHNGLPMPGATNALLSLRRLGPDQCGAYFLRVHNAWGTATSPNLVVSLDGWWLGVHSSSSATAFRLGYFGPRDSRGALLISTDLTTWSELRRLTNNGAVQVLSDGQANRAQRFYRVRPD